MTGGYGSCYSVTHPSMLDSLGSTLSHGTADSFVTRAGGSFIDGADHTQEPMAIIPSFPPSPVSLLNTCLVRASAPSALSLFVVTMTSTVVFESINDEILECIAFH